MSDSPKGLPPPVHAKKGGHARAVDNARYCPDCGKEARIASNFAGVNAFCGPCKKRWPISSAALNPLPVPIPARGFHKETYVEPDWNMAVSPTGGDNEPIGPKGRKGGG